MNLHPDWLLKDYNGNTLIGKEYTFDPGHPEVQTHTLNVCLDLITNYDVDGLNLDYIRYSSTTEGYNPVTVNRFNRLFNRTGLPSPGDAVWKQFRRDQVTALLRKIYLHAIALKPNLKISCDTITWDPAPTSDATWYSSSAAWNSVLQDWRGWMEEGILDMSILMNYFRQTVPAHALDYTNWSNFAKDHRFNRHTVSGPGLYLNSIEDSLEQMRQPRQATAAGHRADGVCGYDYRVTNSNGLSRATFLNALVQPSAYEPISPPLFAQPVPTPPMPWKAAPTRGHLKGVVYGGGLPNALDGAVVILSGSASRAQTNDATGFFGFVDLPPGAYTLTATCPGYAVMTTDVTITAGAVATRDLVLSLSGPPVIVGSPQDQTVPLGSAGSFSVSASGTAPLAYQWRFFGTNLSGATASSLSLSAVTTNQAGPYDAVVRNSYGAATSAVATLTVVLPPPPGRMNLLWSLAPGSRPYLTVSALPTERGMAYNLVSRRLLVVSRNGPQVYVLDGETGADLHQLNVSGVAGGTYSLLLIGVAGDGVVYAGNLTTSGAGTPFKLYRWANDAPGTAPRQIYSGDPGNNQRWGDTLAVRGAGATTQILLGSRSSTNAALFTTTDGASFVLHPIKVADAPGGSFGLGIAFGTGDTFWGKATGLFLRQVSFDLAA
ncbi:MAG TPA: DUF4623 domain-containing protein, partial [Candidatus Sulfotelmatobacter sp.]|nr:DUF4623 domain-containing protein [Candidatus Sulfotelmatobacter sp.]